MAEQRDRQDEIDTVAAEWAARLGGEPLSDVERRDLECWLRESPLHAAAFNEAWSAWEKMGKLRMAPGALAQDLVPPRKLFAPPPPVVQGRSLPRIWGRVAVIAACLLVLAGGAAVWVGDPLLILTADYRTAPGEQRLVILPDGSTVDLGPSGAVAVRYSGGERRVKLLSGAAYFTAVPMEDSERRPFVVEAARGTARALGTQFVVDRLSKTVEVTVAEHDVEVALAMSDDGQSQVVLSPGQSVRYTDVGLSSVQSANLDQATAWRRGRLIFDHASLGEVVAALNRYRHGRIVVADPALASRTVSGVFETDDPDAVLGIIARDLRVRTASLPPLVTLLY